MEDGVDKREIKLNAKGSAFFLPLESKLYVLIITDYVQLCHENLKIAKENTRQS